MYIILTDMANITAYVVPIVPNDVKITSNGANDESETLNGNINVMNNPALREVSWSSIFPVNKNYTFVNSGSLSNGWGYVAFLEMMKTYRLPIRIIITTKDKVPVLNMLASIDDFTSSVDTVNDISYSIKLKEFPEGFFDFVDRDKKVFKYIKDFLKSSNKTSILKKLGLMAINRQI